VSQKVRINIKACRNTAVYFFGVLSKSYKNPFDLILSSGFLEGINESALTANIEIKTTNGVTLPI
jgi:hypothetical protein